MDYHDDVQSGEYEISDFLYKNVSMFILSFKILLCGLSFIFLTDNTHCAKMDALQRIEVLSMNCQNKIISPCKEFSLLNTPGKRMHSSVP